MKSSHASLNGRPTLLDPAVNVLIQRLKQELTSTKAKLEETQNELSAWKFTPDSNTGKKLMAKCRLLHQENEDLGRMTSSGRIAKLEGDLALQKSFSEEVKKSQSGKTCKIELLMLSWKMNTIFSWTCFRTGWNTARVGWGCGRYAEHGAVLAAGVESIACDCKRQPAVAEREASVLCQPGQPPASRWQTPPSLSPLPRLQRGRGTSNRRERRGRLAQDRSVPLPN